MAETWEQLGRLSAFIPVDTRDHTSLASLEVESASYLAHEIVGAGSVFISGVDAFVSVDLDGAAWVMDSKANFILRLKSGERLYVGHPDGATLRVEKRGGRGIDARDAMLMMLARKSAGAKAAQPNGDDGKQRVTAEIDLR